jgi:stage II sporulation protein AA (anti-sigma F factor antagonist)
LLLKLESKNNYLIARLEGELDHHSSESTREKIDKYISEKNLNKIILDLSKLTFMDSSGIGLVMGRYKKVTEKRGKMMIVGDNRNIERILNMSGLLKIIELYPTIEQAVEKL